MPETASTLDAILAGLIRRYRQRVPDVERVEQAMIDAGLIRDRDEIENDHIAFRTMGVPQLGIQSLEKIFLHCGYRRRDRYDFPQKKLNAYWYAPPRDDAPRIFISELRVADLSPTAQQIIHRYTDQVPADPVAALDLNDGMAVDQFLHRPLWRTPTWVDYQTLNRESEYAGWVIYNRYYLNHFTIAVHQLPEPFDTVATFNEFLESLGVRLNDAGGKSKISPDGLLIQSATVAEMIEADFDDGHGGSERHAIPGSYVEFAERRPLPQFAGWPKSQLRREHRREGFESGNADRIFESTYSQQTSAPSPATRSPARQDRSAALLEKLQLHQLNPGACSGPSTWLDDPSGGVLDSINPASGEVIARVRLATVATYERIAQHAQESFRSWRERPAPLRGQLVRDLGTRLREHLEPLGEMVSLEMGKIRSEGIGEVQEMIDICDFAVGLSRQLYGKSMHSERPGHRMYEQWHPLGPIGIISAFNFPVAVWSWNAALAAVCGDTMIWKPSPQTPLVAIAVQHICNQVLADHGLTGIFNLVIGADPELPQALVADPRLPLVSFTGSTRVGREVAQVVAGRLGRCLLELGGNNAVIVEPDCDLDLTARAILFGAVGTAGQRCTTTRRLLVHRRIAPQLQTRLVQAYRQIRIGDPLDPDTLLGPLISRQAVSRYEQAIAQAVAEGGEVLIGGKVLAERPGYFVEPTIIRMPNTTRQVREETFAPILYWLEYDQLEQAIAMQNDVPQGLSSALFTQSLIAAESFLSAAGSDCGIANVNLGTSGAEIGGAFGGEKETGGGREAGSDAWKTYMRRQTNTINWSGQLPLAQGIKFGD